MKRIAVAVLLFGGALGCEPEAICDPGTRNCPCLDDGACRGDALTCSDDLCVMPRVICDGPDGECRSITPRCYTPCSGPLPGSGGTERACSDEGLMVGCLSGASCIEGKCVPDALMTPLGASTDGGSSDPPPLSGVGSCERETECPDFQTCIDGECLSDCGSDSDCPAGRQCVRKVCRQTCAEDAKCDEDGFACKAGICQPRVEASPAPEPPPDGTFELDEEWLQFTSHALEGEFSITNNTAVSQAFVVRKGEERVPSSDGTTRIESAAEGGEPLPWLHIGSPTPTQRQQLTITVGPGESKTIQIANARNDEIPRWTGSIEVVHESLGAHTVQLTYSEDVDGSWAGRVYYFGNFEDGADPASGSYPLDEWTAQRDRVAILDTVPNAFVQAWGRFRNNAFSVDEMRALTQSTLDGTWQSARVKELCKEAGYGSSAVCAPFGGSGSQNVLLYSSAGDVNRVPSGIVELNLAFNVRKATESERTGTPGCANSPNCFVGKIDSGLALQYGGDPALFLRFEGDPTGCDSEGPAGCINHIADLGAEISVGGRYIPDDDDPGCQLQEGMQPIAFPWLVTGFSPKGVRAGLDGEQRTRASCRDTLLPFTSTARNQGYAAANPVPDGRPRQRTLTLVDGMMINQAVMILLVKEEVAPFHGGSDPLVSYAYVTLTKQPEELEPTDYVGSRPVDDRSPAPSALEVSCDDELIREVTGRPRTLPIEQLSDDELQDLARAVVRGDTSAVGTQQPTVEDNDESVHYLCLWREEAVQNVASQSDTALLVDGVAMSQREVFGAGATGTVACPPGATIYYFALEDAEFGAGYDPATHACNTAPNETCLSVLTDWANAGTGIRLMERDRTAFSASPADFDLVYRCDVPEQASCDNDPLDLRVGKTFLAPTPAVYFNPIETEIREAFRYKTQFVSRSGRNVGFAPDPCQGTTNLIPYCYDPALIERVAKRVDCALAIYHHHLDVGRFDPLTSDGADTIDTLRLYLDKNFAVLQSYNPNGDVVVEHGFERLYSELLIMLGDEAYVQAFSSRFDLAGTQQLAFDGDLFESGGVQLSGAVGYEMYTLYQATQYYGMVLDRFYAMAPTLWGSLQEPAGFQYISEDTVTTYLDRVTRASTQTAAAWSEIARRYQGLNRPDLARVVLERAYTRAYQESGILTEIMTEMMRSVSPPAVSQVITEIEKAQRRYRVAMVDMLQAYERITDEVNYFGLPPDYIPFPALDEGDVNGFEVIYARAKERVESAAADEEVALASTRDFDVDEAEFQSELVNVRNNYKSQLGDLCGTFIGSDGLVYPAINRYSHLDPDLAGLDDPCGAAGNGALYLKAADLQTRNLEMQRVRTDMKNLSDQFDDAQGWVADQCGLIRQEVSAFLKHQGAIDDANASIERMELSISAVDKTLAFVDGVTDRTADTIDANDKFLGSIARGTSAAVFIGASIVHFITTTGLEIGILAKQDEIRRRERSYEAYTIGLQCDYLTAELVYTLRDIQRQMDLAELDALDATWNIQVELSELQRLNNERVRLEAEWEDADQLTINVAAAKNDPNIRIYKNDAIINADRSFQRALQEAYRATRIYEYYTASSYADFEQLFLIRMIKAGDYNLSRYLDELEDAFYEFEDQNGNPDTRVTLISMRDDVLQIPRYSLDGQQRILSAEERVGMFREKLTDGSLVDEDGNLAFRFSTDFERLSPLTANHKILFVEVDVTGDAGDPIGRVYLTQEGTGVVEALDRERKYFNFPPRTAVMNPVFNGDRSLGQDSDGAITGPTRSIYRSYRFRERPFVQTDWALSINQRTESVNTDINLAGLDDIVVSVFYTDFTP